MSQVVLAGNNIRRLRCISAAGSLPECTAWRSASAAAVYRFSEAPSNWHSLLLYDTSMNTSPDDAEGDDNEDESDEFSDNDDDVGDDHRDREGDDEDDDKGRWLQIQRTVQQNPACGVVIFLLHGSVPSAQRAIRNSGQGFDKKSRVPEPGGCH